MPSPGRPNSILSLAGSHLSYKFGIVSSPFFSCSHPTSLSPIHPRIPDTSCFEGRPCHSTFEWVLPMIGCPSLHNLHTSRLSPPVLAPPILIRIFLPTLPSLLPFLLPHATFVSNPNLLPTTLPKDTFAPNGCFLRIYHTSSSPSFSLAALLPSLATPLYSDSSIGYALPPHIPNTLLAALFPHRGTLRSPPPSSYTPYLAGVQIYCLCSPTFFFFLPGFPFACSGGPGDQTTYTCDTFCRLSSPSSFQCMPGHRVL